MFWIYLALAVTALCFVVSMIQAFLARNSTAYNDHSVGAGLFVTFIIGVVMGFVALALNSIAYQVIRGYDVEAKALPGQYSVVALADSTKTNGSFALFFGSIDEKPVYYYYGNNGKGGVGRYWVPANDTSIVQDTKPGEAYLLKYESGPKNPFWSLVEPGGPDANYWEFHVPPGSVKQDFNLDNQN